MPKIRMEAVRLVKYRGWSTRKVSRHTGYSQSVIVKWCAKDPTGGWRHISTKSSCPKQHPKELSQEVVSAIIRQRLKRMRCAEVVHQELHNEGVGVSLSSVKRTLDRKGLLRKRSPWKRYHAPSPRPEAQKPGDLVELDTIHLQRTDGSRLYVFTLLDVMSRWAYAKAYARANTHTALRFLKHARKKSPFVFKQLQSDHGSEFSMHFTERSHLPHRHSRVRTPNDNAHLERFNRTIQEECLDRLPKKTAVINKALPEYLKYYNGERLHFGLNLKTPLQVIPSY